MPITRLMRKASQLATLLLVLATARPGVAAADLATTSTFNIGAQPLQSAVVQFTEQSGIQVTSAAELIRNRRTGGVVGEFAGSVALTKLLAGTQLLYRVVDGNTVVIVAPTGAPQSTGTDSSPPRVSADAPERSFWDRLRLAQADHTAAAASEGNTESVEEVVVSAQKRIERLQDVPVPVTAISADSLVSSNQLRLQDYYARVPGLNFSSGFRGEPFISIRGITTGGLTHPTTSIMVDDVPYGSSTLLGGGYSAPDIDPGDLARIEVLRGPQGTLYGANSMGGLIKLVTVDPSTDEASGRIQMSINGVHNGDGLGRSVRGAVNVPLGDAFAVRASGFTRREAGYVDDPILDMRGVNRGDAYGGRLSALWRPSQSFSLKLSALFQDLETDGSNLVHLLPGLGDLQQAALRGTGEFSRTFAAYGATVTAKLGEAELTAISGYSANEFFASNDRSQARGAAANANFGVTGAFLIDDNKATRFTQEIRLVIPTGERLEWLLGAFYTDESTRWQQNTLAANPATGAPVGALLLFGFPTTYSEYAAFADLTIDVTDRFDVQFGGRTIRNRQSYSSDGSGPLVGGLSVTPRLTTKESAFTYLVTPRFRIAPNLMVYARLASGYRPGGVNPSPPNFALPPTFDADETRNYEVGVKGNLADHALSFDASLYYVDWQDIQLSVVDPVSRFSYTTNTSAASSKGLELSLEFRPLNGLTIATWGAWNSAELSEAFPPASTAFGRSGDRLPYSSRFSGNLSADQKFSLTDSVTGFAGSSVNYVGARTGVFTGSAVRQDLPAYTQIDLRAGVENLSWTASLFINNVADKRGVLSGGLGSAYPFAFSYIQPRTIGLSLSRTF